MERVAAGHSLADVCNDDDLMPPLYLVRRWLANDPKFKARYIEAMRVHALEEGGRMLRIAGKVMDFVGISLDVEKRFDRLR